ncbi:MAG TPA: hypothetical protein PL110_20165, partial [Candidatus Eremiobacteraeota bacterium]|nr:hypothetical protein [Candidatus Eremiobacteraeota bacterium]
MKQLCLLFLLSLIIIIAGCGGGGTIGVLPNPTQTPASTVQFNGYVYGPSDTSSERELRGLKAQEGLIIIDEISQAPQGYTPVINCLVKLYDGKTTYTDNRGWFSFTDARPTSCGQNTTLILDPTGSSSHGSLGPVTIETIIPGDETPPGDFNDLIIKPHNLLLPVGGFFLYHVYGFNSSGESFEIPPDRVEWFINSMEGNIGSITPFGLFEATSTGMGNVLARVKTPSGEKTATGTIQIVPEGPASTIKGQVYRIASDGTKKGIGGIHLFVSTNNPETLPASPPEGISDNATVTRPDPGNYYDIGTITDLSGYYEFPRVPSKEVVSLSLLDPVSGYVKFINNITLTEGEIRVIDIDFSEAPSGNYFNGFGTVVYSTEFEGGTFILETYEMPVPFPGETPIPMRETVSQGEVSGDTPVEPPISITAIPVPTVKYVLLEMEKFP